MVLPGWGSAKAKRRDGNRPVSPLGEVARGGQMGSACGAAGACGAGVHAGGCEVQGPGTQSHTISDGGRGYSCSACPPPQKCCVVKCCGVHVCDGWKNNTRQRGRGTVERYAGSGAAAATRLDPARGGEGDPGCPPRQRKVWGIGHEASGPPGRGHERVPRSPQGGGRAHARLKGMANTEAPGSLARSLTLAV
jgi:hypothetical protein